ncbi:MAG: phosphopantothenoylcysteine decarboxylase [Phoenicibacter congonensis]|uniref:Phosphopantothenoylcysteine decarboxylase n=1 Tax=Phoenicibacter congonensis TaxID=1944646 RepID=A0AA43UAY6_9ACTN|nr:phosphopantothenoylcysteine decarboxylase [Phoenicibacter congonensis]
MKSFSGKKVLITSGPTIERLDPVRYISNFSSGKMGKALCLAFANAGAEVTVVTGPVNIEYSSAAHVISVESAREMLQACEDQFASCDIAICCAAVCDYRPKIYHDSKLKKGADDASLASIELVKNPDILKTLSGIKTNDQRVIGFSAETNNLLENATFKLKSKGCDMIVANDVSAGQVFSKDKTAATLLTKNGTVEFAGGSKDELAELIVDEVAKL